MSKNKFTIEAFESDHDRESWADMQEKADEEEKKQKNYEMTIMAELKGESPKNVMMMKKIINRFGNLVEKHGLYDPNYSLKVIPQNNQTYISEVDLVIRECFSNDVVLSSLISALGTYREEARSVENPYFELFVRNNKIEKSRQVRSLYSNVVSRSVAPKAVQPQVRTLEIYRDLMDSDLSTIITMIERFKNVDQSEYDYWVKRMCDSVKK